MSASAPHNHCQFSSLRGSMCRNCCVLALCVLAHVVAASIPPFGAVSLKLFVPGLHSLAQHTLRPLQPPQSLSAVPCNVTVAFRWATTTGEAAACGGASTGAFRRVSQRRARSAQLQPPHAFALSTANCAVAGAAMTAPAPPWSHFRTLHVTAPSVTNGLLDYAWPDFGWCSSVAHFVRLPSHSLAQLTATGVLDGPPACPTRHTVQTTQSPSIVTAQQFSRPSLRSTASHAPAIRRRPCARASCARTRRRRTAHPR